MRWGLRKAIGVALIFLAAPTTGSAQARRALPGSGLMDAGRMTPFVAEYDQLGVPFRVRLTQLEGEPSTWEFYMATAAPNGTQTDVIRHRVDDLAFVDRRFGFGAFRDEYLEVGVKGDALRIHRLDRTGSGAVPTDSTIPLSEPVVDGTFMYWLLGTLPLALDDSWTFPTWQPTTDAALIRESGTIRVEARSDFDLSSGESIPAWVLTARSGENEVRMTVSTTAPFLLAQEIRGPDGSVTPIIQLRSFEATPANREP